ncbi:MAG: Crp/Fnr family transcriptional regulator [Gammaproteobacteria bacterium]|nr:Crp/Fnr family transcriptional regulator [Gammaproteobacteria bacterium]
MDPRLRDLLSDRTSRYEPADVLYRAGDAPSTVYVIESGMVKLINYLPNGKARIVRIHSAGSWLGLNGLLGRSYGHSAIAIDEVRVSRIAINEIMNVKSTDPDLFCKLMEHWFYYLQDADLWISSFSTGIIRARVARLIDYLSRIENNLSAEEVRLLTCEEMAEILGATPESVSRVIAEFKREKLLYPGDQHDPRHFYRDIPQLNAISQC